MTFSGTILLISLTAKCLEGRWRWQQRGNVFSLSFSLSVKPECSEWTCLLNSLFPFPIRLFLIEREDQRTQFTTDDHGDLRKKGSVLPLEAHRSSLSRSTLSTITLVLFFASAPHREHGMRMFICLTLLCVGWRVFDVTCGGLVL